MPEQKPSLRFIMLVLLCLAMPQRVSAGSASIIETVLPSGRVATAAYHPGKAGKPAVLFLHGFLQTREFSTVSNAAAAIADAGYPVLRPTLSLGVSHRNNSLPCEAAHTHTLQDDVAELGFWVKWLEQHGHRKIVLIGHSFGSVQVLYYLRRPDPHVTSAILISLSDVEVRQSAGERAKMARQLKEGTPQGTGELASVELGQCRNYVGPPKALLSYLSVTRASILEGIARSHTPISVIIGKADDRMGKDWPKKLQTRGIPVRLVEGANHFFDDKYEFDLQDALLQIIRNGVGESGD